MIAALLMVATLTAGGEWARDDIQTWVGPTEADLKACTDMADDINDITVAVVATPKAYPDIPIREALCIVVNADSEHEKSLNPAKAEKMSAPAQPRHNALVF